MEKDNKDLKDTKQIPPKKEKGLVKKKDKKKDIMI